MTGRVARLLSGWLLAAANARLRPTRAEWAEAMLAEAAIFTTEHGRLGWAWGCWMGSLRASLDADLIVYAAALPAGLALMAGYEWSADETHTTLVCLGLIALVLGALRPRSALLSGTVVGMAVTGVIGFEAVSGIHPAYEVRAQTLAHSLYWMVLLLPALSSACLGARIGRLFRPAAPCR